MRLLVKKMYKKNLAVILAGAMILTGGVIPSRNVKAATIKLSCKKMTLKQGQKKKLKIKGTKKKVQWKSSKKKVATVSKKGVVFAKAKGKAVITAKVGNKKYRCKVTVKKTKPQAPLSTGTNIDDIVQTTNPVSSQQPVQTTSQPQKTPEGNINAPTLAPTADVEETKKPASKPTIEPTQEPTSRPTPVMTEMPIYTQDPTITSAPAVAEGEKPEVLFSKGSGIYPEDFALFLTTNEGSTIYFTTDGSDPTTSETRRAYTGGIPVTDRTTDINVLSAISPDLFDLMSNPYFVNGKVTSAYRTPTEEEVDKCVTIKSVAVAQDGTVGDVVTNTYFVGGMSQHIPGVATSYKSSGVPVAIMSITVDQNDLFDYEKGIYVAGKCFDDSIEEYKATHDNSLNGVNIEHDLTANFNQKGRDWERKAHIDYFESDGTEMDCKLAQDCGIRIQGNYSREAVQKSFRLYAREDYGTKNFKYAFFGDDLKNASGKTMSKFRTLVLRNGGNDFQNFKYKDLINQTLVRDRAVTSLNGRPCVVYLNGEYWGYYILQDDFSDNFMQEKYDVDNNDVLIYKATDEKGYEDYQYKLDEGEIPEGETEDYYLRDTIDYLENHDFTDDAVTEEFFNTYMDKQSVLDYYAIMIYINNQYDWPGKNWSIWKAKAPETVTDKTSANPYYDGKWRLILNDLDLTTVPPWSGWLGSEARGNNVPVLANKENDVFIVKAFSRLYDNEAFRNDLADTIEELRDKNFVYETVESIGTQFEEAYSPLYKQFVSRYNTNSCMGLETHNANMKFFEERLKHIDNIIQYVRDGKGR